MNTATALRWAARYVAVSFVSLLLGAAFVVGGIAAGADAALGLLTAGVAAPSRYAAVAGPGVALVVAGVLVYWLGRAYALYHTLVPAVARETGDAFETEPMKSDILSVLDDRLADMQTELSETRREINRLNREDAADEFEF